MQAAHKPIGAFPLPMKAGSASGSSSYASLPMRPEMIHELQIIWVSVCHARGKIRPGHLLRLLVVWKRVWRTILASGIRRASLPLIGKVRVQLRRAVPHCDGCISVILAFPLNDPGSSLGLWVVRGWLSVGRLRQLGNL